ncbi:MAG: PAS domain S-box protein [Methanomicrobiales archaeon]
MKIKTQVSISLIIFVLLAAVIILSVYSSNNQLHQIQKKQQIIDNIDESSFQLYYLENDYLIHGGSGPVEHWNSEYAELTGHLQALTLSNPYQEALLNDMFNSQRDMNTSFFNLVSVTGSVPGREPAGVNQELKEFSASTLAGQTQTLMSRSTELSQLAKSEAHEIESRNTLMISFSIALLILFVLLNYLVINRSVLRPISLLQEGAERIGSGDLDTRIKTVSNDELGYLSLKFNEMSSRLKHSRDLLLTSNTELKRENDDRKRAEGALKESEAKFRDIFSTINDGVQIHEIDPDGSPGKFIEINEVTCRMLQYTREELLSRGPLDFVTGYHSRPLKDIIVELSRSGHAIFETEHARKDGTIIPVEINAHVVSIQGKLVIVSVVRDITERKRSEELLARVNRKLNTLNDLTRMDLSNQVFVVKGFLELMKPQVAGQDSLLEDIQKIEQGLQIINEIIEFTRDYQDLGKKPPQWQNVHLVLLYGVSHVTLGEIHHDIRMENLEIFADPLLEKAFQGLFENSTVHGEHISLIRVSYTLSPEGVIILYEDDGIGIPQGRKAEIFLRDDCPHSRVRGLFFIREILDLTGITIQETGDPGKGARFEIRVPKGAWRLLERDP